MHKAGFVNIVGNPNVGKSTLMNLLVGERISIATFKAQTTRHRIMGILNTDEAQIVFSDTPGVLKPNYKLQEAMLRFSRSALRDADILLYVTDMVESPEKNSDFIEEVRKLEIPILVLINKIDLTDEKTLITLVEEWHEILPNAEIMIHQPLGGMQGQATDIKIHADHILRTRDTLNRILAENTGRPIEEIARDTERDNFMSANAAMEYGLIDRVIAKRP